MLQASDLIGRGADLHVCLSSLCSYHARCRVLRYGRLKSAGPVDTETVICCGFVPGDPTVSSAVYTLVFKILHPFLLIQS